MHDQALTPIASYDFKPSTDPSSAAFRTSAYHTSAPSTPSSGPRNQPAQPFMPPPGIPTPRTADTHGNRAPANNIEFDDAASTLSQISISGHQPTKKSRGNSGAAIAQHHIMKFTTPIAQVPSEIGVNLATLVASIGAPANTISIISYQSELRDAGTKYIYINIL